MEQVQAARAELLAKKNQITLARQGRDLLKEKRNALLQELMRTAEEVMRSTDELERSVGEAAMALALAEALDGPETVRSAAFAAQGQVTLEVTGTNIIVLEEREREDLFRLKRVKMRLERGPRASPTT